MAPRTPNPSNSLILRTPSSILRTPQSSAKHRHKETPIGEHPVEVIGRIRDFPERKDQPASILQVNSDKQGLRVRADFGYRDFSLDGVSLSEEEDLCGFYNKFVQSRIHGVKLGAKCTIMMYGPTGSGKSHTMFGCPKQPGIVYMSLKDILGDGEDDAVSFVHVTVLEIYNEEIYDLLSNNGIGGGLGIGWPKGNGSNSKARLEVMGKKAKNAAFISGIEAGKISKEIQKVEKRRIVKSTLCNERSSRSHCMIILDVPTVGGRLMLVDMAGSENIEQAGQVGFEAKMQTAKINQGNIALKRVVESIANGDSHVPFRDSKLTMLLQDSFEDDKSKILMILCASPDPKEIHKTISTLEYGAKAKCIVRGPHTPVKDKFGGGEDSNAEALGARIAAMDQFIYKLQMEKKEAHEELMKKNKEVAGLREKLHLVERRKVTDEEINLKVNERTEVLKSELEKKLEECRRLADDFIETERRRMEERMVQQELELEMLRRRLEEMESQVDSSSSDGNNSSSDGSGFAKRLMGICAADEDPGMVKSMDLDMTDLESLPRSSNQFENNSVQYLPNYPLLSPPSSNVIGGDVFASKFGDKVCLSTVYEEEEEVEEEEEEGSGSLDDEVEVEKGIIEEKRVCSNTTSSKPHDFMSSPEKVSKEDTASNMQLRIQNIFKLCGNNRELCRRTGTPLSEKTGDAKNEESSSPIKEIFHVEESITKAEVNHTTVNVKKEESKENRDPSSKEESITKAEVNHTTVNVKKEESKENRDPSSKDEQMEVVVKWEASKENPAGKVITTVRVSKDTSLVELRKLIEIYLAADNQAFAFLGSGEEDRRMGGAVVVVGREKEATVAAASKLLPIIISRRSSSDEECRVARLRPVAVAVAANNNSKGGGGILQSPPLSSPLLENKQQLPLSPLLVSRLCGVAACCYY